MSYYNLLTKGLHEPALSGHDGPYLMTDGNGSYRSIRVNREGEIITETKSPLPNFICCYVENEYEDEFTVSLKQDFSIRKSPECLSAARSSSLVISDIEGNFNALHGLLLNNGVVDLNFNWAFGDNDLIILGDVTDRGENVTQCLWLIYHLENQAEAAGGRVHYLLGNHEIMDIRLDVRYVNEKYLALAKRVSNINDYPLAYHQLLERNNFLINWMKSKNCIEKIGDTLFVHGGISPQLLARQLSLVEINETLRLSFAQPKSNDLISLVLGSYGPIWYRGFVKEQNEYGKAAETFVDRVLEFYDVNRLVIGHTIVDEVSTDYDGKIIRTDVLHGQNKFSPQSQALLIEGDKLYRVDAMGKRQNLN